MPVGIYISGLGQSANKESVEKYAARYIKELEYSTTGINYYTKVEKIYYNEDQRSLAVRIYQHSKEQIKSNKDTLVYTFYDFEYNELLIQKFKNKNLFLKNLALLLLVIRKLPRLITSLFKKRTYTKGGQTFYMFLLFLIMALAILLLIPSFTLLFDKFNINNQAYLCFKEDYNWIIKYSISITTILILFIPESSTLLTKVAAEFSTIDNYIQYGEQAQIIQGNLDALIEYIVENEENPTIHLHTYSFGSIIALDTLFPIGTEPCANILNNIKLLITVGAPYEFIDNYYPNFYTDRTDKMSQKIEWINVYSTMDAFASNFRNDNDVDVAQYGIINEKEVPINLNYEIARSEKYNLVSFITLKHITMHQSYWDDSKSGQSCTRLIFNKMKELQYWNLNI